MFESMRRKQMQKPESRNLTGIPQRMKTQFEAASGLSFQDVRVHYSSDKPAQLHALAYTQGNHVYLAKGQEKHLGHELGHVVQQKLGLVRPNRVINGIPVNDDPRLEAAADHIHNVSLQAGTASFFRGDVVQRISKKQAIDIIRERGISEKQYKTIIAAIETEAVKQGKSFDGYIESLSISDFEEKLTALRAPFKVGINTDADPIGIGSYTAFCSAQYPGFYLINGLGLLVNCAIIQNFVKSGQGGDELLEFINQYLEGMTCYRGINIAHFSWETVRTRGILASEGFNDEPTFTMDGTTRWLPFDSRYDIPMSIAMSPGRENSGLAEIIMRGEEIPIGMVILFDVDINTPIAYLNEGEKIIRGPVEVERVDVITSKGRIIRGVSNSELPQAAPYKASGEGLGEWLRHAREWIATH